MRMIIEADDGDEVCIWADSVSAEQGLVTVEVENGLYATAHRFDSLTLSVKKARDLANALIAVVDAIEFVSVPANVHEWTVDSLPGASLMAAE